MDNTLSFFISQNILSIIIGGIAVPLGILYLMSRIRKNDMDLLRSSNMDLRTAIEDRGRQMTSLTDKVKLLETRVSHLERENRTLADLVVVALKQYFLDNPAIAVKLKTSLINTE